ncbi:MAG: RHS repeat-associated core domain-containing protein [Bryobacteraceae bacterium]|nr:RHS repeat-associated core domain-containing protein [Bryobacteraceae bacterium]
MKRVWLTSSGFTYDAAGNLTVSPSASGSRTFTYDSENRLNMSVYQYGSSGERLYYGSNWHFYGPDGTHLGTLYQNQSGAANFRKFVGELHFAGRLVWQDGSPVVTDRLGSVVQMSVFDGTRNYAYYPQGQWIANMPVPGQNIPACWGSCSSSASTAFDVAFGTYHRDAVWDYDTGTFVSSGRDYAMNRYYDPARGRFTTPDPYGKYFDLKNPLSFNRYAYVMGDPINKNDPTGFCEDDVSGDDSSDSSGDDSSGDYDLGGEGGGEVSGGEVGGGEIVGGGGGGGVDPWGPDDNIEHMDADAFGHKGRSKRRIRSLDDSKCQVKVTTPVSPSPLTGSDANAGILLNQLNFVANNPATQTALALACGSSPWAKIGGSTSWGALTGSFGFLGTAGGAISGFARGAVLAVICAQAGAYNPTP